MFQATRAAVAATSLLLFVSAAAADERSWVERSNDNAQIVLEVLAEFNPEGAGSLGVDGLDEAIVDYRPGVYERNRSASEAVLAELEKRLAAETEPRVRQDLEILVQAVSPRAFCATAASSISAPASAICGCGSATTPGSGR